MNTKSEKIRDLLLLPMKLKSSTTSAKDLANEIANLLDIKDLREFSNSESVVEVKSYSICVTVYAKSENSIELEIRLRAVRDVERGKLIQPHSFFNISYGLFELNKAKRLVDYFNGLYFEKKEPFLLDFNSYGIEAFEK